MNTGRKVQWLGCFLALCSLFINLVTNNKYLCIPIALFGVLVVFIGILLNMKTKKT
ncbi:hypothetical protein ACFVRR_23885 [Gottfriedia sp. NPDC057948]|uniref:hypothetical protein n=1 Tax=Gottfriedia sp. NPDC057948 TaxID=3346287 RepID=UPI0036DAAB3D